MQQWSHRSPFFSSSSSPSRCINASLEDAVDQPPPAASTLRVYQATEDGWNAFADRDGQVIGASYLEWFAGVGEIHRIEFASTPHEKYIGQFGLRSPFAKRPISRWLAAHGAAVNS